jgi:hypothetical protein
MKIKTTEATESVARTNAELQHYDHGEELRMAHREWWTMSRGSHRNTCSEMSASTSATLPVDTGLRGSAHANAHNFATAAQAAPHHCAAAPEQALLWLLPALAIAVGTRKGPRRGEQWGHRHHWLLPHLTLIF